MSSGTPPPPPSSQPSLAPLSEPSLIETHRDVSAGGLRLRTTEWSSAQLDAEAEAILVLPGVLTPRLSFRPLAPYLASHFRFITIDLPGLGESEKPSPQRYTYGAANCADALTDLFAGLSLPRAHLIGHGLGGAVALHLAARHPELLRRLALIAPQAHPGPVSPRLRWLLAPLLGGLIFRQIIGPSLFAGFYREHINSRASGELIAERYAAFSPPATRAALISTLRGSLDPRAVIADSRRIRAPSLLIWGRSDRLLPVTWARALAREMPATGVEIIEAGHAPHEEVPATLGPILHRFFSGKRTGST